MNLSSTIKKISPVVAYEINGVILRSGWNWLAVSSGEKLLLRLRGEEQLTQLAGLLVDAVLQQSDGSFVINPVTTAFGGNPRNYLLVGRHSEHENQVALTFASETVAVSANILNQLRLWLELLADKECCHMPINASAQDGGVLFSSPQYSFSVPPGDAARLSKALLQFSAATRGISHWELGPGYGINLSLWCGSLFPEGYLKYSCGDETGELELGKAQMVRLAAEISLALAECRL